MQYSDDSLKTNQIKGYVEDRIAIEVEDFADRNGMTKSQAVRRLVSDALLVDQAKQRVVRQAQEEQPGIFGVTLNIAV